MGKKLIILVIVSFILLPFISAQQFIEGEAKSVKDPMFMEFDGNVHNYMPTNVKVYINDPLIKKEANYAEISTSEIAYSIDGNKIIDTSGGTFRQTIKYDGQDTLQFAFRTQTWPEQRTSTSVDFYKVKFSDEEYPDTSAGSEFEGYNCGREYSKLLCKDTNGCTVCAYNLGTVYRDFYVSETVDSVATPGRFDFIDEKKTDKSINDFAVNFEKFSHNAEVNVINNLGQPYTGPENYYLRLTISPGFKDLSEQKEFQMKFARQGYQDVHETSAPGGMTGGFAFEGINYNPPKDMGEKANYEWADISYKLMSELVPKGSGYMTVEASRYGPVGKGQAASERDRFISEVKSFAASYNLAKGKVFTPKEKPRHVYYVRDQGQKIEETTQEHYVYGTITNYFGNPMPYMKVKADIKGANYIGYTNEEGIYKIPLTGLDIKEGEEIDFKVFISLDYLRDAKNYFNVYFRKPDGTYNLIQAVSDAKLIYGEHAQVDFKLDGKGDYRTNFPFKEDMMHYSVIYYHTHEAADFVLKTLKEDMDYKLPVTVYVGNQDKKTLYSPGDSYILISEDDSSVSDSDRPKNREYHEFMHALMYDIYNDWPEGRSLANTKNHDGFLNPSTADSYLEGFAEFMALVISDENKDYSPDIYAAFGSMEKDYRPWDTRGLAEELAVASLLWDMYDDRNEKGDKLTLTLEEIWKVLKVKRRDFYEYYLAFKAEYPKRSNDIDELFKLHGFFFDTRIGDGKYNPGEPWKYIDEQAGTYRFIDMGDNVTKITWQPGFVIGKATTYNRSTRSSTVMAPNSFLKVKDEEVDFYMVKVTHEDSSKDYEYRVDRKGGLVYVQPLPYNDDAQIMIIPISKDYTTEKEYVISNKALNEKIYAGNRLKGYFEEYDFDLKPTGTKQDERYILFNNVRPTYSYEGDIGEEYPIKISKSDEFKESKITRFSLVNILFLLGIGFFGYFYIKSKKVRKSTNNFLSKVKELLVNGIRWFIRYGVPFIKKVMVFIWKIIVKISKTIFHHTKNAYHAAKPHVKKAHESIKKKITDMKNKKVNKGGKKE